MAAEERPLRELVQEYWSKTLLAQRMEQMSKTFNAACDACTNFRPRCRKVNLRIDGNTFTKHATTLCEECRGLIAYRGKFRYTQEPSPTSPEEPTNEQR